MNEILIFIPTYNELENVRIMYNRLMSLDIKFDLLFLDDNSPDGTGALLDELSLKDNRVKVIHRTGKLGIGSAHKEGLHYAYKNKYLKLITMDCNFSHPPEFIKDLIANSENMDIVIGSRYLQEKSIEDWNIFRIIMTYTSHYLTWIFLGMPYDASNAFRLYILNNVPEQMLTLVESSSYSFFFESLFVFHINKLKIKEIPMIIPKRTYGHSKIALNDIYKSLFLLFSLFKRKILKKEL